MWRHESRVWDLNYAQRSDWLFIHSWRHESRDKKKFSYTSGHLDQHFSRGVHFFCGGKVLRMRVRFEIRAAFWLVVSYTSWRHESRDKRNLYKARVLKFSYTSGHLDQHFSGGLHFLYAVLYIYIGAQNFFGCMGVRFELHVAFRLVLSFTVWRHNYVTYENNGLKHCDWLKLGWHHGAHDVILIKLTLFWRNDHLIELLWNI